MDTENMQEKTKKIVEIAKPLAQQLACLDRVIFEAEDHNTIEKLADLQIGDMCSRLLHSEPTLHSNASKSFTDEALEKLNAALNGVAQLRTQQKVSSTEEKYGNEVKKSVVTLLHALCDVLTISDHLHITNTNGLFEKCLLCLEGLEEETLNQELILGFKDFLINFSRCISLIKNKLPDLKDEKQKILVKLCVHQIKKCLPLLMQTLKVKRTDHNSDFKDCKESERYILQRIGHCMTEIRNVLEVGSEPGMKSQLQHRELVETVCGEFVLLVDDALRLLALPAEKGVCNEKSNLKDSNRSSDQGSPSHICPELCQLLSPKVERILCHAMSVSYIAVSPKDAQGIVSCGQRVLRELQSLKQDCASDSVNSYEMNLHASSLSDALFCLEQRVNTALLRLVVEVLGNPCTSLRQLIVASISESKERETRCSEDLEDLIANYDLHMDRIVQIGVFAIACSNDRNRIPEIRSCLASLESLEPELVPTAVSLYLDSSSKSKASHLLFLAAHWRQEVAKLQILIDGIVDPVAFCRVTYEEIHKLIINLKKFLFKEEEQSAADEIVWKIISRAERMLSVCRQEASDFMKDQATLISDFEFSISECKAAYKLTFHDKESDVSTEMKQKNQQRVLQRCLLIATLLKKLEILLSDLSDVLSVCSIKHDISVGAEDAVPVKIGQSLISMNPRQQTMLGESSCVNKEGDH